MSRTKIAELVLLVASTLIAAAKAIIKFMDYINKAKLKKTLRKCV